MGLIILRAIFLMVAIGMAVSILWQDILPIESPWMAWAVFFGVLLIAIGVIAIDIAIPHKPLDVISAVYFGLIVGLFLAYVAGLALTPILPPSAERIRSPVQLILAAVLCYTCITLLLQTRNDFRFIIPYVEFSKEIKGRRPYILDTSVVIDGRIADVVDANLFDTQLIMPRFVINELQAIADSSEGGGGPPRGGGAGGPPPGPPAAAGGGAHPESYRSAGRTCRPLYHRLSVTLVSVRRPGSYPRCPPTGVATMRCAGCRTWKDRPA
jgi:uncharacterized protein YacL